MPRRRTSVLVGAGVAVALALGGCGGSATESAQAREPGVGEVPSRFAAGAEDRWGLIAATSTHLVGLGGGRDRFGKVVGTGVGGSTPSAVHAYDGGAWRTHDDPFGTQEVVIASTADGGAAGPAFGATVRDLSAEPGSQGVTLAFDAAGEPRSLGRNTAGTDVVWKGRTSSYLVIGDLADGGEDGGEQPATVTLEEVEL